VYRRGRLKALIGFDWDLTTESIMSKVACFMKFTFPTSVKFQRTSSRRLPLVAQAFLVGFGSLFASKSSKTRCDQQKEPPGLQVELKDWLLKNGGHFAANITVEQIPGRGYGIVNRGGTLSLFFTIFRDLCKSW